MTRLLVTGGCGFIGSCLIPFAVGLGHSVCNVDKQTYAAWRDSLDGVAHSPLYLFVREDIVNQKAMTAVLNDFRPDTIIHLAAETHVDRSIDQTAPFIQTNIVGTESLLEAGRAYWQSLSPDQKSRFRFLYVSTDEVYGSLDGNGFFTENSPCNPRNPYSASKAAADFLAAAWFHTWHFPVLLSHCSNNFGPWQNPEKLIPKTILHALDRQPIPIYGQGLNVRDWIHVSDHVAGLFAILDRGRPGRVYNLGARCLRRNIDLVLQITDLLNLMAPSKQGSYRNLITLVPDRPGHDLRYAMDPSRSESELLWHAQVPFDHALKQTVSWYLNRIPSS